MKNVGIISAIGATILVIGLGVLLAGKQNIKKAEQPVTQTQQESKTMDLIIPTPSSSPAAVPSDLDKTKSYQAVLQTSEGNIIIKLNAEKTPLTVKNFMTLSRKNFYNKTIFHRVIKGFMIQGGDPKGDGTGGPGYTFDDEPFEGNYTRGTVAMANAGPNTNGSQFFIMQADYPLPKNYVIFGSVVSGLDVVDKIAAAPVSLSPSDEESKPVNPVTVTSIEIVEK